MTTPPTHSANGNVIIIGGWQRSATTLWLRLLGAHPDTVGVQTDHAIHYPKLKSITRESGIREPSSRELMQNAFSFMVAHRHYQKWKLTESQLNAQLDRVPFSWDGVFLAMLLAFQANHPGKTVVLKTPGSENYFFELQSLLTNHGWAPRFLYSIRNPVACYLSWKHRAHSWTDTDEVDMNITLWCSYWLTSTTAALEFNRIAPQQIRIIRMTDLLTQPVKIVDEACNFFSLDPSHVTAMTRDRSLTTPNSSFGADDLPKAEGNIVRVIDRTPEALTPFEAEVIYDSLANRAKAFGYSLQEIAPKGCSKHSYQFQVAMESIPTASLMGSALKVIGRRIASRFGLHPRPQPKNASSSEAKSPMPTKS